MIRAALVALALSQCLYQGLNKDCVLNVSGGISCRAAAVRDFQLYGRSSIRGAEHVSVLDRGKQYYDKFPIFEPNKFVVIQDAAEREKCLSHRLRDACSYKGSFKVGDILIRCDNFRGPVAPNLDGGASAGIYPLRDEYVPRADMFDAAIQKGDVLVGSDSLNGIEISNPSPICGDRIPRCIGSKNSRFGGDGGIPVSFYRQKDSEQQANDAGPSGPQLLLSKLHAARRALGLSPVLAQLSVIALLGAIAYGLIGSWLLAMPPKRIGWRFDWRLLAGGIALMLLSLLILPI